MRKPFWVNHATGSFVDLGHGFRASVTLNKELRRYVITFGGVGTAETFESLHQAKNGALRLANNVIADILLALLELGLYENGNR